MTGSMMHLLTLVEKAPGSDILRAMISFAAGRLAEMEVGGMTGTRHGERSADRPIQRNVRQSSPQWPDHVGWQSGE